MYNEEIEKLNEISSKICYINQLCVVLSTFLEAKETFNDDCSNALIISNLILAQTEQANQYLFDYLHELHVRLNTCR